MKIMASVLQCQDISMMAILIMMVPLMSFKKPPMMTQITVRSQLVILVIVLHTMTMDILTNISQSIIAI